MGVAKLGAALDNLAMRARLVICAAVSQYDHMDNVTGPSMYRYEEKMKNDYWEIL